MSKSKKWPLPAPFEIFSDSVRDTLTHCGSVYLNKTTGWFMKMEFNSCQNSSRPRILSGWLHGKGHCRHTWLFYIPWSYNKYYCFQRPVTLIWSPGWNCPDLRNHSLSGYVCLPLSKTGHHCEQVRIEKSVISQVEEKSFREHTERDTQNENKLVEMDPTYIYRQRG